MSERHVTVINGDTCHSVDPKRDVAIIHAELIAKDLEHIARLRSNPLRIKANMDQKSLRRLLDECESGANFSVKCHVIQS